MLATLEHEWVAAAGALGSGMGSIISAILSVRLTRKRSQKECDQRIKELHEAFQEGLRLEKEFLDDAKAWKKDDLSDWGGG